MEDKFHNTYIPIHLYPNSPGNPYNFPPFLTPPSEFPQIAVLLKACMALKSDA